MSVSFFGEAQGIKQIWLRSIEVDKTGFLWIGGEKGVYRFDGREVKSYLYDPSRSMSLKQGSFYDIFEDRKGRLWLSGLEGGLCYIDAERCKSKLFLPEEFDSSSIALNHTGSIFEDAEGTIWVCSNNFVLHKFDEKKENFTQYKVDIPQNILNYENEFSYFGEIIEDPTDYNILWIGSRFGMIRFDKKLEQLKLFQLPKGKIKWFIFKYSKIPLWYDKESQQIWFGHNREEGIFMFDTQTLSYVKNIKDHQKDLDQGNNSIRAFVEFDNDHILAATCSNEMWLINKSNYLIKSFSVPETENKNIEDLVKIDGEFWIAFSDLLIKVSSKSRPFKSLNITALNPLATRQNAVISILPKRNAPGEYYLGTLVGDGILKYGPDDNTLQLAKYMSNEKHSDMDMNDMLYDHNGKLWVAAGYHLATINEEQFSIQRHHTSPAFGDVLKDPILYRLAVDSTDLYIAFYENGVMRMDIENSTLRPFQSNDDSAYVLLPGKRISALAMDQKDRRIWIGTNTGVFYYDILRDTLMNAEFNNVPLIEQKIKINDLVYRNDTLFIGTFGRGVWLADLKNMNLNILTNNDQPGANLTYKVAVGQDGILWYSSQYGISYVEYKNNRHQHFSSTFSIDQTWIEYDLYQDKSGFNIYGGSWQFWKFRNNEIFTNHEPSKVYLEDFLVPGLSDSINSYNRSAAIITLPKPHRNFSFSLSAINYTVGSQDQFKYRLKGYNNTWQTCRSHDDVHYNNIKPGHYVLQYLRVDPFTEDEMTILEKEVIINTTFFERLWVKLSAFLLMLFGILFIFNNRKRNKLIDEKYEDIIEYFNSIPKDTDSIEDIIWDVSRNIASRLDVDVCTVSYVDNKSIINTALSRNKAYRNKKEMTLSSEQVKRILEEKKIEIFQNLNASTKVEKSDFQKGSRMIMPLLHQNNVLGIIDIYHSKTNFFTSKLKRLLVNVQSIAAKRIVQAQADKILSQKDEKLQSLRQERAEAELSALRAQMNPHFLFNTLNSINWYIIKNKPLEASKYITTFSNLVRLILDNSKMTFISLAKELETLELYIKLERIRFEGHFEYDIYVDSSIDSTDVMMPPLIFQPFVENAIWHGLMHKKEKGHINIRITKSQHLLSAIIEDDGVGRSLASSAQIKSPKPHAPKGIAITKKRIETLTDLIHNDESLTIEDLIDTSGQPRGTRVTIYLPLNLGEKEDV